MGHSNVPTCLTIAGSDSGGGAGIQADLKTFAALSCFGTSAITAITAQNTKGVQAVQGIEPSIIESQINALFEDLPPDGIKTGMLYSKEIIEALITALEKNCSIQRHPPLILDPVMVSTSGHTLLSESAIGTLREKLLPWATVITPNVPEAAILAGQDKDSIRSLHDMIACAKKLGTLGPEYIYLKGGHLPMPSKDKPDTMVIVDLLYETATGRLDKFEKKQIDSKATHGTGCTQSAALCAELAKGRSVRDAVEMASAYVQGAIASAYPIGQGSGPVNHLHTMVRRSLNAPSLTSPHPFTDYLIARTGDLWEKYVNHPFTVQLGNGTLPMQAFLYFIKQDYSFLFSYARTNALAAYKAKTFAELEGSTFIVQTVLHEVQLHIKFCESQGISKEELEATKESVTNIAYNRYVLDVGNTGDMLDLRVATAPCLLGYGEVGVRLATKPDSEVDRTANNKYYEWALNYAKDEFQTAVRTGRDILEQMVANCPVSQSRLDELSKIFTQTTELEIAFWDTALEAANLDEGAK